MNMWTVILAGLLIVTLGSAQLLEDAGVSVTATYWRGKLEKRVLPPTVLLCASNKNGTEWWRFNVWEQVLKNYESRTVIRNAPLRLGTPGFHLLSVATVEFQYYQYCKYVPRAYQNDNLAFPGSLRQNSTSPTVYLATKVINTERATIKQGWSNLVDLIKAQFSAINANNLYIMFIEVAASGQVYVGAMQVV